MSVFLRLDHVSIGVLDMEKAKRLFFDVLGGQELSDQGTNPVEGFHWATFLLGGKKLEVVAPTVEGEGGVGRFLASRGEGLHHLSISVANLEEAVAYFQEKGIRVLAVNTENPLWKHCYLHPKDTFGALIQVFEENEKTLSEG
jgi:methylmalonyl-CoA epimerase